jgi:NAD(P)-dependent dehydrogenase (short-subunit alcohol dehydrogenase family)
LPTTWLITGSSRGIGRALAELEAQRDACARMDADDDVPFAPAAS